jgi:hypothetical protein
MCMRSTVLYVLLLPLASAIDVNREEQREKGSLVTSKDVAVLEAQFRFMDP